MVPNDFSAEIISLCPTYSFSIHKSGQNDHATVNRSGQNVAKRVGNHTTAADQFGFWRVALNAKIIIWTIKALRYGQALKTKQRPSYAIWPMEDCQISRSSTVGAHQSWIPFEYLVRRRADI